ncbi:stage V sporulation protein T [Velocimicrobium porci]|uniref:Stage V sporulation protein T n=1 Tax=Velocimicrobium porci TaxID=2606634 RepID=A0A6L5XYT8_9FIRM|nr:stage V sporulation protein T [Velocimicrobium porci]MSS63932.1 stage V sporulation protein T [Velocimicrobium porci]
MKATGIVRRIDDLGRVVIPKEIRRTLRIREGDPLEIFTDREGEIILKKYSPIGELSQFAKQYADSLAQTTGHVVCIADRDSLIAVAGGAKKDLLSKPISKELEEAINERESIIAEKGSKNYRKITDSEDLDYTFEAVSPIISAGDAVGAVILLSKENKSNFGEVESKLAATASGFLGRQLEQ